MLVATGFVLAALILLLPQTRYPVKAETREAGHRNRMYFCRVIHDMVSPIASQGVETYDDGQVDRGLVSLPKFQP